LIQVTLKVQIENGAKSWMTCRLHSKNSAEMNNKNTLQQQQIICFTPREKARRACSRVWLSLDIPASKPPREVPVSNQVFENVTESRGIISDRAVVLG
jgi:hypothetical protein